MRIALVGAHGAGKTTLASALAAQTGISVVQLSPMRDPRPASIKDLAECTSEEICQLAVRRSWERVQGETGLGDRFISDGSILHECAYVLARLAEGPPDPGHAVLRGFAEGVAAEAWATLSDRYDVVVRVPVEFPLPPDAPITTEFQAALQDYLDGWLAASGVSVFTVRGSVPERALAIVDLLKEEASR